MLNLPIIAGIEITTDSEGRFSLNALHKASGGEPKNAPGLWKENQRTKDLVEEASKTIGNPIVSLEGRNGGTFAHELLAISYAGWISPAFQLQVNQVFIDYRMGKLQPSSATSLPRPQTSAVEAAKWIHQVLPNLGESSLQEIISRATRIDFGEALIPLPKIEEKFWTATDLAKEFSVSANKIGRIANTFGFKAEKYGEYRLSKSLYSAKQVEQFYYNELGREALAAVLLDTAEAV